MLLLDVIGDLQSHDTFSICTRIYEILSPKMVSKIVYIYFEPFMFLQRCDRGDYKVVTCPLTIGYHFSWGSCS